MLDALTTVIVQLAVIVAVAALAGGVLGWLLGSRRARQRAFAAAAATNSVPRPAEPLPAAVPDASPLSPPQAEPVAQPQAPFAPRPRPREVPMPATVPGSGLPQPDDELGGASEPRIGTVVVTREQRAQGQEAEPSDPQASISTVIQPHKAPVLHPSDARVESPEPQVEPVFTPVPNEPVPTETDETVSLGWSSVEQEIPEIPPTDEPVSDPGEPAGPWADADQGHDAFSGEYADEQRPQWDDPKESTGSELFVRDTEDETAILDAVAEPEPDQEVAAEAVLSEVAVEADPVQEVAAEAVVPEVAAEVEPVEDEERLAVGAGESVDAAEADDENHAAEVEQFKARIAELEELVNRREHDLMRLETGATAAWDTTVPSLERAIEELRQENGELQAALNAVRAQVESAQLELELVQKSRGSMPRATDTY